MNRLRLTRIVFGLCVAAAGTSPVHANVETSVPAFPLESPPLAQPGPEPPAALPARGANATVRAATAAYTHMPPADHPRRVETLYRAETLEPATSPRMRSSWTDSEYNAQSGLLRMRAHWGYAVRTTGKPGGGGITIAIVEDVRVVSDNDEIPGHPDLRDVTVVNVSGRGGGGAHPTLVAGAAVARRNGFGTLGVAYNANLVTMSFTDDQEEDFEAVLASAAGLTGRYGPDAENMWDADPAASTHIANFSFGLGPNDNPTQLLNGMKLMAREGRIMTAGLGNDGDPEPAFIPASAVADAGIAGHAIAVGALDPIDLARSFSNHCGAVKRWCIFAPGDRVYTTDGTYWSTTRGFRTTAGTSYSSAYVAGAMAAVWAAFPDKTGAEIVQRLLDTARQVDTATGNYDATTGLSPIYGHGALDLEAAMNAANSW